MMPGDGSAHHRETEEAPELEFVSFHPGLAVVGLAAGRVVDFAVRVFLTVPLEAGQADNTDDVS